MSDTKYLPTTAITSMVMNSDVYAYAQTYSGDVFEIKGSVGDTYKYNKQHSGIALVRLDDDDKLAQKAPKLFTPVAAAPFNGSGRKSDAKNTRVRFHIVPHLQSLTMCQVLFYIDDNNILRDVYNRGSEWTFGTLASLNIVCAHYSRLAAITVVNDLYYFMCVFYQAPDKDATIRMANFDGGTQSWKHGSPNLKDPPLFGTSLTAVQPRNGILVGTTAGSVEARQPVYFLQMDNLHLGHAQGTSGTCTPYHIRPDLHEVDPVEMDGLELDGKKLVFSPQTSLTAVDNGSQLYIIYKSDSGNVKVIEIQDGKPKPPEKFSQVDTTPPSAIAACLAPNTTTTKIVLFYQSLNVTTKQVNLGARTLTKPSTASTDWNVSNVVKLGT